MTRVDRMDQNSPENEVSSAEGTNYAAGLFGTHQNLNFGGYRKGRDFLSRPFTCDFAFRHDCTAFLVGTEIQVLVGTEKACPMDYKALGTYRTKRRSVWGHVAFYW